jgi:4-amino-4-deoxy-L-arabinose transferase-like glycosyltransferase
VPRLAIIVAAVAALLILPRLTQREIIGTHEAVYPMVARDMVEQGSYTKAELRGSPYRFKPPMYPWMVALASWPEGRVSLASARVPGALMAIGAVVMTLVLGARLFGPRAGLWAALVLMTSVLFFHHALVTIPDIPMIFIGLLAALALWSIGNSGGRGAVLAFYLALGFGVFVKHFSGLLPLAVALVWLGRAQLKRLVWWPGIAAFLLLTALWLVPFMRGGGGAGKFTTDVIWADWLRQHIGGPRLTTLGGELMYAVLGFLPWSLVFPAALVAAFKARQDRAVSFALWWFGAPALFIFWVQQQRVHYLLPLVVGASLLVAWWLDREASVARRHPVLAVAAAVLAVGGALVTPSALSALGIAVLAPASSLVLVLFGVALLGLVAAAGLWTGRLVTTVPVVIVLSAVVLFGGIRVADEWQNRVWNFTAVARDLAQRPRPLAIAALAVDNQELLQVDFYLGRSLPLLRTPEAVRAHLAERGGDVVMEDWRWAVAPSWLKPDVSGLRADRLGAGVILVRRDTR